MSNSGIGNSGNHNSGAWNSGYHNSGDHNSGDWNSGDHNSGDYNSGHYNSGNHNSGCGNSGNCNSGCGNSGIYNSGDYNSGDWNSGDWNSGRWNSGDWNSGFFNTDEPPIRIFNQYTDVKRVDIDFPDFLYFELTVWISYDTATEEERAEHKKEFETCGGYIKTLEYKEAFRRSWDRASKEEHMKLLKLPNWNNEIFREISGIDAEYEIANE